MFAVRSTSLLLCVTFLVAAQGNKPEVFEPGVICTGEFESHPEFSPDGKTMYFVRSNPEFSFWTIYVSKLEGKKWDKPLVAPFSGKYRDADPFITADGKRFYFISDRPLKEGETKKDMDIWFMERAGDGWGAPQNLAAVNSPASEWYPTVAASGALYFGSGRKGGKGSVDIWVYREGKEPENVGAPINTEQAEYEPFIAPDESYMLLAGSRPSGSGGLDLFISRNVKGVWTEPKPITKANSKGTELSPKVSRDGKTFYYTSTTDFEYKADTKNDKPGNGLGDIYFFPASELPQ
jgi:Tol biopolymer transport system component